MLRLIACLLLLLGLGACDRGPDIDQVRRDLEEHLSHAFAPGTFEIATIDGRGSATDIASPPGVERRIVYYDARLRLTQDMNLGGWNTSGVASLVTTLGAGPRGIRGAKASGNKAGDTLLAHGTAIYRRDGNVWQEVAPAGFAPPAAPALDTITPPLVSERLLTALENMVHAAPAGTTPAAQAVIDQELSRSLAIIQGRLTRLSRGYPIAAGPDGGQYVRFVQTLRTTKPMGLTFQALLTEGSVENLELLRGDQALLALTQSDVARQALAGDGPLGPQEPFLELRALGSLYPEPLHIVVRDGSPTRTVRDLIHKRIGIGPRGSGTQATALRVLKAYGMESGRDYELDETSLPDALVALGSGALDAVAQVIGLPADQIRDAATSMPLRLLPIDEAVIADLAAKDAAMLRGVIPKGTYAGIDEDVPTVMVTALLVTTSSLSEAEATTLINAIFGNKTDFVAAGSVQGGQVGAATARMGLPIPLAAGAAAALADLSAGK